MTKKAAIFILKAYKRGISPFLPRSCKFFPSCSEYSMEAIEEYGILKGGWLSLRRVVRCNPFSGGGFDPVIKKNKGNK